MMKKLLCLLFVFLVMSPEVLGETIQIPVGSQGQEISAKLPKSGTSKENVRKMLGDPVKTTPAVGDPPISSWEYDDFTVFFEYDHVIHAVKKHRPHLTESQE